MKSCIDQKNYFRYRFEPSEQASESKEIIYIPYWRFKGTLFFSTLKEGLENHFLDISRIGLPLKTTSLPSSLGVRSQALPLKLVSSEDQGLFLKPCNLKEAMDEFDRINRNYRLKVDTIFKEYIGETASLIYSPMYIESNRLYDAVLNEPLKTPGPRETDLLEMETCRPERETDFIPGLCPSCGWDLDGAPESLSLVCRNCQTLWRPRHGKMVKIRFGCVESDRPNIIHLPFWRMEADISGAPLASYADLVKLANLPRVIKPEWKDIPFSFWSPAFKIRGDIFLRLNTQLTYTQPQVNLVEDIGRRRLYPITLPASEGLESMKITLSAIMRPASTWLPRFSEMSIAPKRVTLVFLPFEERHYDLYHPATNISIIKNILANAGNL